jgi:hypothetical protein
MYSTRLDRCDDTANPKDVVTSDTCTSKPTSFIDSCQTVLNVKDSLRLQQLRIPSLMIGDLMQNMEQNTNKLVEYSATREDIHNKESSFTDTLIDIVDNRYSLERTESLRLLNWMHEPKIFSGACTFKTIRTRTHRHCEKRPENLPEGRYQYKTRPIRRSQEEICRSRMEDRMNKAAELEYDLATWRMYNRIIKYRQKHPAPDCYYNEVSKNEAARQNNNSDEQAGTDLMIPSDMTSATIETSTSTSSSPSTASSSPQFATLRHPLYHQTPTASLPLEDSNNDNRNQDRQPRPMSNYYDHPSVAVSGNERDDCVESETEEYADMMMFDLDLFV